MKTKAIIFLLIGILIGTILGEFLPGVVKAQIIGGDEQYLKKIYNVLTSFQFSVSSIESSANGLQLFK